MVVPAIRPRRLWLCYSRYYFWCGENSGKCGNYLGVTTNNQAEYAGLINGLKWVVKNHRDTYLRVRMDSLLIVSQVKGDYKVKRHDILPRYLEAMDLLGKLKSYTILYVPRAENALADSLVNDALDSQI